MSTNQAITLHLNKFDESSVKNFYDTFSKVEDNDQDCHLIIIDSFGGYTYSVSAMIDIIKSAKKPVATVALGKAMSCGLILTCFGTEGLRFAGPSTEFMLHQCSYGSHGKLAEMKNLQDTIEKFDKSVYERMSKHIGKPKNFFSNLIKEKANIDYFFSCKEAKDMNIINHIGIPRFQNNTVEQFNLTF